MLFRLLNASYILSRLSYRGYVIVLDTVTSTNQYLIDNLFYLKLGAVCLSEVQTHGRGRYGKYWFSPCNDFHLSFYWCFLNYYQNRSISLLSLAVSVVIAELLKTLGVIGIKLKWPNDIYVSGRKLAGVLIETVVTCTGLLHIVIGVGINVKKIIFRYFKDSSSRISLEEIGFSIDRNYLAICVINVLYKLLLQFENFGFLPFYSRWLSLDIYYHQSVRLFIRDQMIIFGISRGINFDGCLLLEHLGSIYAYSFVNNNISLRCC